MIHLRGGCPEWPSDKGQIIGGSFGELRPIGNDCKAEVSGGRDGVLRIGSDKRRFSRGGGLLFDRFRVRARPRLPSGRATLAISGDKGRY
jgi:hypothetical protein